MPPTRSTFDQPRSPQHGYGATSCEHAHKPHIATEKVTIHYRFRPLGGTQAIKLRHDSRRGEPPLFVADSNGRRHLIPPWMTAPEPALWDLCERPRLSWSVSSELRDLVATVAGEPSSPETGARDERGGGTSCRGL